LVPVFSRAELAATVPQLAPPDVADPRRYEMTSSRPRHRFSLATALILALVSGGPTEHHTRVASPRAILFYDGPLRAPVLIQGRVAMSLFLNALTPAEALTDADTIPSRPPDGPVSVAVFWMNRPFGRSEMDTLPVTAFHPFDSDQRGRLFPSRRGQPALPVIDAGSGFPAARKRMTARAARMLTDRGAAATVLLP
jgi:hypothetical protein